MSEEEQIGITDDVNSVEHSSLQASDGEALISSLLKTRTMMTEEEEIGVSVEIEPVEQSWFHLPDLMKEFEFEDFMNLGSSYDNKAHEIDEGDNGSVDEVEAIVPQCGMIFDTADEAYNFYNGYARKIGFSVRKQRTNKSKADQNKILRQVLVCSCEGTYKKIRTPRKRRENRRFDCKALLEFKLIGDKYHVIQFMSDHTHDLVPPQFAHYLRSQRRIEFSQVGLINKMHSSGFKQSDIYSYMSTEAGGPQYLNFIPSDCYSGLSQISQRIVSKGSKFPDVSSLTEVGLLELEAKVESWISSRCANQNVASNAQNCSTLNVDDEAPLRDPTKRQRRCQGNKRKRGPLEKKKTPCKKKGGKGENSTTKAVTRSKPFKEVEENENARDTTSTQGPHVEEPNMAATVGMNALQAPNSSCTGKPSTFTEMLLDGYKV